MRKINDNQQQREIDTIKGRAVKLNLSDADVKRLCEKAGGAGLSVSQLLENFIGDLVCGTYTNGSDERMYAEQWFDRCHFGMFSENTFLRYLVRRGGLDDVLALWNNIKSAEEDFKYTEEHPDDFTPDDLADIKEDKDYWQEQLDDYFSEYKSDDKPNEGCSLEQEMEKVLAWRMDYEELLHVDIQPATKRQEIPEVAADEEKAESEPEL